ncbi:MAG: hypothetical protein ACI4J1_07160 [Ruminiclostridium sp.]
MEELFNTILNIALTTGIGIITFFLKRSFGRLDNCATKSETKEITEELKTELKGCKEELNHLSEKYATKEEVGAIKERMEKLENGVDFLKENAVRKQDFIRVTAEINSKLDTISGYLRGNNNGR